MRTHEPTHTLLSSVCVSYRRLSPIITGRIISRDVKNKDGDEVLLDNSAVEMVSDYSDCNYRALVELVKSLTSKELLINMGGLYSLNEKALLTVNIPKTMIEVVFSKLDLLNEEHKIILRMLAVFNLPSDLDVLRTLMHMSGKLFSLISTSLTPRNRGL